MYAQILRTTNYFTYLIFSLVAVSLSGCATPAKAPSIEYVKTASESFDPTTEIMVYWGRDIATVTRKYKEIGRISVSWPPAPLFSIVLPGTHVKNLDGAPDTPLPDAYREQAMKIGANALLISVVQRSRNFLIGSYDFYITTIVAVRFLD